MINIPKKMRAMVLTGHGGLDKLEYRTDYPVPEPIDNQVLIKVKSCGMNATDINTRIGWYAREVTAPIGVEDNALEDESIGTWGENQMFFPRIQGADVCGEVVAFGAGVSTEDRARLNAKRVLIETWISERSDAVDDLYGKRYFGSEYDGGFAEYTCVPVSNAHVIESALSDDELATFSTSWVTAENMLQKTPLTKDNWLLVPGASGGVGSALIQLGKLRGAKVIAVAQSSKHQTLRELGADITLSREQTQGDMAPLLQATIGQPYVDVVADGVGGEYWQNLIDVIKRGGFYTCCGAVAGPIVSMDLRTFYLNDLTFAGATMASPKIFRDVISYIEQNKVTPILAKTYDLQELHKAQQAFLKKDFVGNLVIKVQR